MSQYSISSLLLLLQSDKVLDREARNAITVLLKVKQDQVSQLMEKTYRQAKIGTWQNEVSG